MWVALLFCVHIEEISWFSVGGPRNIEKHMYFDDLVWVALLFCVHIEDISWFSVGGPINIKKINIFFMLILKKKVDLVWVATETLRKFALLFHIDIRETNRLSLGDQRNIEKIHIFWWFGVGGSTFSCSCCRRKWI